MCATSLGDTNNTALHKVQTNLKLEKSMATNEIWKGIVFFPAFYSWYEFVILCKLLQFAPYITYFSKQKLTKGLSAGHSEPEYNFVWRIMFL